MREEKRGRAWKEWREEGKGGSLGGEDVETEATGGGREAEPGAWTPGGDTTFNEGAKGQTLRKRWKLVKRRGGGEGELSIVKALVAKTDLNKEEEGEKSHKKTSANGTAVDRDGARQGRKHPTDERNKG